MFFPLAIWKYCTQIISLWVTLAGLLTAKTAGTAVTTARGLSRLSLHLDNFPRRGVADRLWDQVRWGKQQKREAKTKTMSKTVRLWDQVRWGHRKRLLRMRWTAKDRDKDNGRNTNKGRDKDKVRDKYKNNVKNNATLVAREGKGNLKVSSQKVLSWVAVYELGAIVQPSVGSVGNYCLVLEAAIALKEEGTADGC